MKKFMLVVDQLFAVFVLVKPFKFILDGGKAQNVRIHNRNETL